MPSILSSVAAHAKAHHESLNAAYSTYYTGSPMTSPPSSAEPSRNNSIAVPEQQHKRDPTNASKAWKALKQHHADMNAAYSAYYSPGHSTNTSRTNSAASSPRHSTEEHTRHVGEEEKPRNYAKMWKALRTKVVEHHRSVNAAYASTYGIHHQ